MSRGATVVAWLALLAGGRLVAQQAERPVRWTIAGRPNAPSVHPGARVSARLVARIDEDWKLYALSQPAGGPAAMRIALGAGVPARLVAPPASDSAESYPDRNFGIFSAIHRDSVHVALAIGIAPNAPTGRLVIPVLVGYQTCTDRYCLPPRTDTLSLALDVTREAPLAVAPPTPVAPTASTVTPPDAPALHAPTVAPTVAPTDAGSLVRFLALAATMGILSLLTPCILPLVPVTLAFFGRARGGSAIALAGAHAAGIVATFVTLGVAIGALYGAGGVVRLAANPWLNLVLGALLAAFALQLLGVWTVRLPAALLGRAATLGDGRRRGAAAFLMGAAFAITSFTCTVPFVGTLLVLASQGTWRWPALGLATYAIAFAAPFVVLAAAPGWLRRVPRTGAWIVALEGTLGIIELALAAKFVANADVILGWGVLTRDVVVALWLAAAIVLALVALRVVRFVAEPAERDARRPLGAARLVGAVGALALAAYLAGGLRGHRLGELEAYLPPTAPGAAEPSWRLNDYDGALVQARAEGRPVLVDFTGYTCTNCRWMEANMFPRADVRALLDRFVRVRLFTDGVGEPYASQQRLEQRAFGTVALPLYAIVAPDGRPIATFLGMTREPAEFTTFLARALPTPEATLQVVRPRAPSGGE